MRLTVDVPATISSNQVTDIIDFGFASGGETNTVSKTVAASWSLNSLTITASITSSITADHDLEDIGVEGVFITSVSNIIDGVSFDVTVNAINNTWGRYNIIATGV